MKEKGRFTFIDKVKVRLVDSDYWAEVINFAHKYVHIPDKFVREYERLLTGGVWAQVEMAFHYDEENAGKYPFHIENLTPIQLASFDLEDYRRGRAAFSTDEWIDFLLRSMGYEPATMSRRLKLLFLARLIPLCERNFNLIELGPRGTGKSYAVQEISPYAALLTGPTTVANLFGHMNGRTKGLVQIWDAVGFDEVADLEKMPKEVITTLKAYCESGQFQRGQEAVAGYASVAMFGNTNQPVDVMVQTSHLFAPLPDVIRDDMAFIDRLHFYLPGWEVPKMHNDLFTFHSGFAFLVAVYSAIRKSPPQPGLIILGDLSIQGNIKGVRSLVEPLQVALDNGGKRALVPVENKRAFLEVSADVVEKIDPVFFGDPRGAALKALGIS